MKKIKIKKQIKHPFPLLLSQKAKKEFIVLALQDIQKIDPHATITYTSEVYILHFTLIKDSY